MLRGLRDVALGVFVGELDCEAPVELRRGRVDRGRVRELGEDHQADLEEGGVPHDRSVDHLEHAANAPRDLAAVPWVRKIGLAGGDAVTQVHRPRVLLVGLQSFRRSAAGASRPVRSGEKVGRAPGATTSDRFSTSAGRVL